MTKKAAEPETSSQRRYSMAQVGVSVDKITHKTFGKRGFISGSLIMDWPVIVGSALAAYTLPQRIQFPMGERSNGILHIKVASSAFAPQITHLEPLIVQRINSHFGWGAVQKLKLHHAPVPLPHKPPPPPLPVEDLPQSTRDVLSTVDNPELRAVLERLGGYIAKRNT